MKHIDESAPISADVAQHQIETPVRPDRPTCAGGEDDFTLRTLRTRAEIDAIQRALGRTGWNRSQAARLLKISYRSLLLKIQQHKITHRTQ